MTDSDQSSIEEPQSNRFIGFLSGFNYQQVFSIALIPIGLLTIRSSRQTWIEVAVLNYKGTGH